MSDLINKVIFETKWHIWFYRNNCKHNAEIQNINAISIFIKVSDKVHVSIKM